MNKRSISGLADAPLHMSRAGWASQGLARSGGDALGGDGGGAGDEGARAQEGKARGVVATEGRGAGGNLIHFSSIPGH